MQRLGLQLGKLGAGGPLRPYVIYEYPNIKTDETKLTLDALRVLVSLLVHSISLSLLSLTAVRFC